MITRRGPRIIDVPCRGADVLSGEAGHDRIKPLKIRWGNITQRGCFKVSLFRAAAILVLVAFDGFTRNRRNVWISKFRSASFSRHERAISPRSG